MEKIRILGVPEHFNFPWVQVVKEQPLLTQEIMLEWENESRGSGAMNAAIRENSTDLAIILTESFIKDKIEGNPGKIIGFHVLSPLVWGIHVPASSKLKELDDIKNVPYLISRMGSGSHLMAFLLAKQQGWPTESLEFEIIGNLEGAQKAFRKSTAKVFLWEKFTTQPLVNSGDFRRIGEIPTPWPCFVLVASENALTNFPAEVMKVRDLVYAKSVELKSRKALSIEEISTYYGIEKADINDWFGMTTWASDSSVASDSLETTMELLKDLNLIGNKIPVDKLVEKKLISLH
ncbi:type 2 periplasmic-binding domain-containing protein [Lunatibacter salilacus]|uniref:ABC transporter substrate-binding protein n=1 Tax=Lunatibacter salilacus TaxID=2483804 RepID=UPI00131D5BFC|nr:ABC transporter substrate-binding protein [Lunatibacter salilacus]